MHSGETIIITGANRGLGLALFNLLAQRQEKHLFILAVRKPQDGQNVIEDLA